MPYKYNPDLSYQLDERVEHRFRQQRRFRMRIEYGVDGLDRLMKGDANRIFRLLG